MEAYNTHCSHLAFLTNSKFGYYSQMVQKVSSFFVWPHRVHRGMYVVWLSLLMDTQYFPIRNIHAMILLWYSNMI